MTTVTGQALYGLPHLGVKYLKGWSSGKRKYERTTDTCILCDSARANQSHHVDEIGAGGKQSGIEIVVDAHFCEDYDGMPALLKTDIGKFIVYTPLFAVCGLGNADGCHGTLHNPDCLVEWIWHDETCMELWEKGWMLSHGYAEHDQKLFEFGYYRITFSGGTKEYRHGL